MPDTHAVLSIEDETKIAILEADGETDPDPDMLRNDTDMADFNFNPPQYNSLTAKFNHIVKKHKPGAYGVSIAEVEACETVQECIDLVTTAAA